MRQYDDWPGSRLCIAHVQSSLVIAEASSYRPKYTRDSRRPTRARLTLQRQMMQQHTRTIQPQPGWLEPVGLGQDP